jgi:hypothetical protein
MIANLFLFLLLGLTPRAEAQVPSIATGAGSQSCGALVEALRGSSTRNSLGQAAMLSWVQGYLLGFGMAVRMEQKLALIGRGELPASVIDADPQGLALAALQKQFGTSSGFVFDPPDGAATTLWIENYCKEHPLKSVFDAADALVVELMRLRVKK